MDPCYCYPLNSNLGLPLERTAGSAEFPTNIAKGSDRSATTEIMANARVCFVFVLAASNVLASLFLMLSLF